MDPNSQANSSNLLPTDTSFSTSQAAPSIHNPMEEQKKHHQKSDRAQSGYLLSPFRPQEHTNKPGAPFTFSKTDGLQNQNPTTHHTTTPSSQDHQAISCQGTTNQAEVKAKVLL
jgi:hypothetical protein